MVTAEEIVNKYALDDGDLLHDAAIKAMIEFAKLHVIEALASASQTKIWVDFGDKEEMASRTLSDKQSILEAYPLTKIV
jgi:hypothetical protein